MPLCDGALADPAHDRLSQPMTPGERRELAHWGVVRRHAGIRLEILPINATLEPAFIYMPRQNEPAWTLWRGGRLIRLLDNASWHEAEFASFAQALAAISNFLSQEAERPRW